jgi:cyclopropane fatty-acyl-phospholipid synthase-like methyltransferase
MVMTTAQGLAAKVPVDSGRPIRVLDIAAGHGLYGICLAKRYANVSVVALDWKDVVAVAADNALKMGVSDHYSTIAGSAFEADFDGTYDLILLTNFLHHFDPPTCEALLKKVKAALNPGGAAVTVEFVPNPDRVSPRMSAGFSLTMLATTPAGDAYTFAELEAMFANAGFSRSTIQPIEHSASCAITSFV